MPTPTDQCILCNSRDRPPRNDGCACLADPEKRDILIHIGNANRGEPSCPRDKHNDLDPLAPAPAAEPLQPIPRSDWRLTAKTLANFAEPQDAGLGDTLKRILSMEDIARRPIKLGACAAFLFAEFGVKDVMADRETWKSGEAGCGGCEGRRKVANAKYALTPA